MILLRTQRNLDQPFLASALGWLADRGHFRGGAVSNNTGAEGIEEGLRADKDQFPVSNIYFPFLFPFLVSNQRLVFASANDRDFWLRGTLHVHVAVGAPREGMVISGPHVDARARVAPRHGLRT